MVQETNIAEQTAGADAALRLPSSFYGITVNFELEEGAFDTFQRLVSENARESVATEAGCLRFDVLTPPGGGEVFLYEIYRDRAAFDLHLATPHFRRFDEITRDLVRCKTVVAYSVQENAKPRPA